MDTPVNSITPFVQEASNSWSTFGVYEIPLPSYVQSAGNSSRGGVYGKDTVYLGGSLRDVASNISLVVSIVEADYTPGFGGTSIFGLSVGQMGVGGETVPSLMTSLY